MEEFLEMKEILGHPTAVTLFDAVMNVLTPEDVHRRLPTDRLASLTCDGAPVVLSQKNGVAAKLKASLNPKLFITHCPPHRLVLASKVGQKIIPEDVEKLIGDVLYFFKDSPVRREEFQKLTVARIIVVCCFFQLDSKSFITRNRLPCVKVFELACFRS